MRAWIISFIISLGLVTIMFGRFILPREVMMFVIPSLFLLFFTGGIGFVLRELKV